MVIHWQSRTMSVAVFIRTRRERVVGRGKPDECSLPVRIARARKAVLSACPTSHGYEYGDAVDACHISFNVFFSRPVTEKRHSSLDSLLLLLVFDSTTVYRNGTLFMTTKPK